MRRRSDERPVLVACIVHRALVFVAVCVIASLIVAALGNGNEIVDVIDHPWTHAYPQVEYASTRFDHATNEDAGGEWEWR